jgi:hypothetical protein
MGRPWFLLLARKLSLEDITWNTISSSIWHASSVILDAVFTEMVNIKITHSVRRNRLLTD